MDGVFPTDLESLKCAPITLVPTSASNLDPCVSSDFVKDDNWYCFKCQIRDHKTLDHMNVFIIVKSYLKQQ